MSIFQTALLSVGAIIFLTVTVVRGNNNEDALSPILIIPGINGSRLNVMDNSDTNCSTNGETITIFVNLSYITNFADCFANQVKLNYNSSFGYSDTEGVQLTAADFGSTSSVETLDLNNTDLYFSEFVEYFVQRGYTRDENIRAAPYDFRFGAAQLEERGYYNELQQLVETMYEENDNAKVTLVAHSLGGPISLYFLNRIVNQQWKDTYIHSYITLAGAWSGGAGVTFTMLSGAPPFTFLETQIGIPKVISLYRGYSSFYHLLPRASVWNDTILIRTLNRNYTASASDYQQLFIDAGFFEGYAQFLDSENGINLSAPNVPTYCFYGLGFPTPVTFVYGNGLNMPPTSFIPDDGDNRLNRQGLEVCRRWQGMNGGYTFNRTVFKGSDHSGIIRDESVLQAIDSIVRVPISGAMSRSNPRIYQISLSISIMSFTIMMF